MTNLGNRQFSAATIDKDPCETPSWMFSTLTSARFQTGKISPDVAGTEAAWMYSAVFHSDSQGGFSHDCSAAQSDTYKLLAGCVGGMAWGVDNGNLNGGVKRDLAYALSSTERPDLDYVSVLLGKGDGTFQTPSADSGYLYDVDNNPNRNSRPIEVRIVDLDQDGFGDLVTSNNGQGDISVLINNMIIAIPPAP